MRGHVTLHLFGGRGKGKSIASRIIVTTFDSEFGQLYNGAADAAAAVRKETHDMRHDTAHHI